MTYTIIDLMTETDLSHSVIWRIIQKHLEPEMDYYKQGIKIITTNTGRIKILSRIRKRLQGKVKSNSELITIDRQKKANRTACRAINSYLDKVTTKPIHKQSKQILEIYSESLNLNKGFINLICS